MNITEKASASSGTGVAKTGIQNARAGVRCAVTGTGSDGSDTAFVGAGMFAILKAYRIAQCHTPRVSQESCHTRGGSPGCQGQLA